MKKVVLVTKNRQLTEKINASLSSRADLDIQLLSTSRYHQALSDIEEYGAEIVAIHAEDSYGIEDGIVLCEQLHKSEIRQCKTVFLIDSDITEYDHVVMAKQDGYVHEWVVCDKALNPLFNSISEI